MADTPQKRKFKTKKEVKEKLDALLVELNRADRTIADPQGMLPTQLNKVIDVKLQILGGVGMLKWVLGETKNG